MRHLVWKKIFNGLGGFGSIILTIVLSVLILIYGVILNIKIIVSENGMANTFKSIDVVETLKTVEGGTIWEDFNQLGSSLNLSEEQFEQILNSDKVKERIGIYLRNVLSFSFNDKEANLIKEEMENFLNIAIDEYNKLSDTKITDNKRQEIINSFDEEMITNINEELGSISLIETVEPEYVKYIELADNLLFGNSTLIILAVIIVIIGLIALFRFSLYKLIPYVKISTIISGSLMIILGILLLVVPLEDMEIIMPIRKILAIKLFVASVILFVLSTGLLFLKKYLKKHVYNKSDKVKDEKENQLKEEKQTKEKVNEKNKWRKKVW